MRSMPMHEAEAALADIVDSAARREATVITRRGQPVAVVVGFDEWQRLTAARRPLADLLLSFLGDAELRRDPTTARDPLQEPG
jgi:prevent-host-death family protein